MIGIAGVATVDHFQLFAKSVSTALPPGEAQQRYDESTTTAAPDATTVTSTVGTSPLPTPGVYEYLTSGRDSVDALSGAHHDYPATTTITITPSGCGVRQRWDVLVERWEEWQRCGVADGISETDRVTYDEFFGQSHTDTWVCTGDARPLAAPTGAMWTSTCTQGAESETHAGVVVGAEQRTVGISSVDTLHVRVTVTGVTSTGTQIIDTWYLDGSDLVVAQIATAASANDSPVGTVNYAETSSIELVSLDPLS